MYNESDIYNIVEGGCRNKIIFQNHSALLILYIPSQCYFLCTSSQNLNILVSFKAQEEFVWLGSSDEKDIKWPFSTSDSLSLKDPRLPKLWFEHSLLVKACKENKHF